MSLNSHRKLKNIEGIFDNLEPQDVQLEEQNFDGTYWNKDEIKSQMTSNLRSKVSIFDLWYFKAINVVKRVWQEEIIKEPVRKLLIQKFGGRAYCPLKNVITSTKTRPIQTINEIIKIIKTYLGKTKLLCFSLVIKNRDGTGHWLSFVYNYNTHQLFCLDPAAANNEQGQREWGHGELEEELLSQLAKKKIGGKRIIIEEYSPPLACQSNNVDIFCQSWSIFLQIKCVRGELRNISYSVEDDLFPFLHKVFKHLESKRKCLQDLKRMLCHPEYQYNRVSKKDVEYGEIVADMEYVYYTYKSSLRVSDFFVFMDIDDIAMTTLFKFGLLGNYVELDDDEIEEVSVFLSDLKISSQKIVFTRLQNIREYLDELEETARRKGGSRRRKWDKFDYTKIFNAKNGRKYVKNGKGQTRFITKK